MDLSPDIAIRPIRVDDEQRLRDHHATLSPESRYRRFLAAKPQLSNADARYLVDVDGCDHHALVAVADGPEGERLAGVARYIRLPSDREIAEVAIIVHDDFQGRGVGAELLSRLAAAAVDRGVCRFRASMLADNLAVHRLFESIAVGPVDRRRLGGLSEMEFALPGSETPGRDCGVVAA